MGALLQIADHATSKAYFASYDGNGNIAALFDGASGSGGTNVAAYEYSPYGEPLRCEGTYAKENSFRFSTKFTDDETGLNYYGRRYYSPSQGRFLGRDPIEEQGGLNLYGFVANNPINLWDTLGCERGGGSIPDPGLKRAIDLANDLQRQMDWLLANTPDVVSDADPIDLEQFRFGTGATTRDIVVSDQNIRDALDLLKQTVPSQFYANFIDSLTIRSFERMTDIVNGKPSKEYYADTTGMANYASRSIYLNLNRTDAYSGFVGDRGGTPVQFMAALILHEAFHIAYQADGTTTRPGASPAMAEASIRYWVEQWAIDNGAPATVANYRNGRAPDFDYIYQQVANMRDANGNAVYSTITIPASATPAIGGASVSTTPTAPLPTPPALRTAPPPPAPTPWPVTWIGGSIIQTPRPPGP